MPKLKRYFPIPYFTLSVAALGHTLWRLYQDGFSVAWFGAFVAVAPLVVFMGSAFVKPRARTTRYLVLIAATSVVGAIVSWSEYASPASWYALVFGPVANAVYQLWYSTLDRSAARDVLRVGGTLPPLSFQNEHGEPVGSTEGAAAIYMFIRGNWCPLCVAQVRELAAQYRELEARGVELFVVTPQPAKHTQKLARRFDAPIRFCVDRDNEVAKRLGIEHVGGVPAGFVGYGPDAVLPTVIITDAQRTILFADQTDNYRVRPEPETFLAVLDSRA